MAVADAAPSVVVANNCCGRGTIFFHQILFTPGNEYCPQRKISVVLNLNAIKGTGTNGRVRKQDILKYIEERGKQPVSQKQPQTVKSAPAKASINLQPGDEIVEMDRMRKLIADHMVMSKHTSPHVTNFVEADVTNLALWREKIKDDFLKREKIKLTFMPAFIEATAKALKEFPASMPRLTATGSFFGKMSISALLLH